jgi:hypothetical protein
MAKYMKNIALAALAVAMPTHFAFAKEYILIKTSPQAISSWTVSEIKDGQVVTAAPVVFGQTYGSINSYTIPFTDNDGYWYIDTSFNIPAGATDIRLKVQKFGVDDRAVAEINGRIMTAVGTTSAGAGYMTFRDGGPNRKYNFCCISGAQNVLFKKRSAFVVGGSNDLRLIVNNTLDGIQGKPRPPSQGDPTNVGIHVFLSYNPHAAR